MTGKEEIKGQGVKACLALVVIFFFSGCASHGPILYPNDHLKKVGQATAKRDIEECQQQAAEYVKSQAGLETAKSTAVGAGAGAIVGGAVGAVTGNVGRGAAVGAVGGGTSGFLHGLFSGSQPSPVQKNYVDRCLKEKGYEPIGWK